MQQQQPREEEKPRLVYRAGFLPKDLRLVQPVPHKDPTQISLSEWLVANQKSQQPRGTPMPSRFPQV